MKNESNIYNKAVSYITKKYPKQTERGIPNSLHNDISNKKDKLICLLLSQYHYDFKGIVKNELIAALKQ